ncbi:MAG: hypothetical protein CFH36_00728 [Alphaproteobacteria bacterium MarineAlpha9_Bin6]|nr:MAG: hypothetical protein CFH36_00728 [Alphaproteobacteria bacterium MarineAlpha9_Bin6]
MVRKTSVAGCKFALLLENNFTQVAALLVKDFYISSIKHEGSSIILQGKSRPNNLLGPACELKGAAGAKLT